MFENGKKNLSEFKQKFEQMENKNLFIAWSSVLFIIISIGIYSHSASKSFPGIAETKEITVSFERSVEIKHVSVVTGMRVNKGDRLMELDQSDLKLRINEVESRLQQLETLYKLSEKINLSSNNGGDAPISIQLKSLRKELDLLKKIEEKLVIYAEIDGVIGSVDFKAGERVPPYQAVLTIYPVSPTIVKGYIHEDLYNKAYLGQKLRVISMSDRNKIIDNAEVIAVGARIVEIPSRLKKIQELQVWGREILVKIPEKNKLLLGEKVNIEDKPASFFSLFSAIASEPDNTSDPEIKK